VSKVLLISTNTCASPYAVYPLGMSTVARALQQAGHRTGQFDWLAAEGDTQVLDDAVTDFDPDVVAISIRNIDQIDSLLDTAESWELNDAREVVTHVRRMTSAPVIIGGPAVSMMPEQVRAYVGADCAVTGEGEACMVEIVQAVGQAQPLPARWPVPADRLCGTGQASPSFDPDLVSFYWQTSGVIGLQTKRGCPFRCCYCTYANLEGHTFRPRPAEAVMADLERLKQDFGVDTVFFADSVFNDRDGNYLALVEALAQRDLGIRWAAYFSPRDLNAEDIALCKRAGLYAVELGTDAASDATLEGMNKPFRWHNVARTNHLFVQAEVACAHFVVFGGPGETPFRRQA